MSSPSDAGEESATDTDNPGPPSDTDSDTERRRLDELDYRLMAVNHARAQRDREHEPARGPLGAPRLEAGLIAPPPALRPAAFAATAAGAAAAATTATTAGAATAAGAAAAAAGPAPPAGSTLAAFAEELDRATKSAAAGLLDPRLSRLLFPADVDDREVIALHGLLFSDAAWTTVGFFPSQVRMSDLGNLPSSDVKSSAMAGLRFLQHAAFHYAVIECGLAQLVHRLDKAPLSQQELLGALVNVSRYTAAQFHDTQRKVQETIAQLRVSSRVDPSEAPLLPSSTPQILAYDDKCRKMADLLQKRVSAGGRPPPKPQQSGGGSALHVKRGRSEGPSGRFFGRGGRGPAGHSAAPQGN